ncbi:MAG TPA: cellulase N-terminal Ig-like domain-containing protein, partial [Sphingobacteriaceae bacterium]
MIPSVFFRSKLWARLSLMLIFIFSGSNLQAQQSSWIRTNLMGYAPAGVKVAVLGSKNEKGQVKKFEVVSASTGKTVFSGKVGKNFGAYGPFAQSYRLDFTGFKLPGTYYLQAGAVRSPEFRIAEDVYQGSADFALRYMRQQRCGYNPYLKDSCHPLDGYAVYGPMPEGTFVDVTGGWHDASDYLQYSTTSANATYH